MVRGWSKDFWRSSAVYRCIARYGASREWAHVRLREVMGESDARALLDSWQKTAFRAAAQAQKGGE